MPKSPTVSRAVLDRTLAALKEAGVEVTGARVEPGAVTFLTTKGDVAHDSAPASALDAWREQRNGARAA